MRDCLINRDSKTWHVNISPIEGRAVCHIEPQLVTNDWSAEAEPHIVIGKTSLRRIKQTYAPGRCDSVARIETKHRSVYLIAAGRGHDIDKPSKRASVFRLVARRRHFDLFDKIVREVRSCHPNVRVGHIHPVDEVSVL